MKVLRYLLLAVVALSLHSCDNMTEEIHLNENGSGEYKVYSDMIPTMKMMMSMMSDSTNAFSEDDIWKEFPSGNIDSVFDYKSSLDSAILNDPKNKELLKKMTGFMEGGKEKGYLNMGAKFKFNNMQDLQELTKRIEENQKKDSKSEEIPGMSALSDLKTETKYTLANGTFTRTTKFISKPKLKEEDTATFAMMFGSGKIKTVVYLPKNKKVKDAKLGGGTLVSKEDGKVIIEYPMMDYFLGKVTNDLTIIME